MAKQKNISYGKILTKKEKKIMKFKKDSRERVAASERRGVFLQENDLEDLCPHGVQDVELLLAANVSL